jgi:mRNA interferase RelE/StbE
MTEEAYTLEFAGDSKDDLKRLDKAIAERIMRKLEWLAANAATVKHIALKGEWSGFYRIVVGGYRAIYSLDHGERLVAVEVIGHRRDVYEN